MAAPNLRLLNAMLGQSTGSEWADNAIPLPQPGHGRVYAPNELMPQTVPEEPPSRLNPSPGFADFLRNWLLQERL